MADNTPRIVGALGYNGRVYREGLEKDLAADAKRGGFDLSGFVSKEKDDGLPLAGDWTPKGGSKAETSPPPPIVYVEGVTFGSDAAGQAAKEAGLTAEDFKGVSPSGLEGYTKPDVAKVLASKEAAK